MPITPSFLAKILEKTVHSGGRTIEEVLSSLQHSNNPEKLTIDNINPASFMERNVSRIVPPEDAWYKEALSSGSSPDEAAKIAEDLRIKYLDNLLGIAKEKYDPDSGAAPLSRALRQAHEQMKWYFRDIWGSP